MKTIGILANRHKGDAGKALERIAAHARAAGLTLAADRETAEMHSAVQRLAPAELHSRVDVMVALGGDGTVLRAVRLLAGTKVPVLGVNLGGLGFMTSIPEDRIEDAMRALQEERYTISERALARCTIHGKGRQEEYYDVLNDVAIGWGASSRVAVLSVGIDGNRVAAFSCDGLIVSTPTGSTGHSLSAGGPIVHPDARVLLICPICPHTLSNRPLVIPDCSTIEVLVSQSDKDLLVATDGQGHYGLKTGERLTIARSPNSARLLHLPGYSYYSVLSQKLHWRGSVIHPAGQ